MTRILALLLTLLVCGAVHAQERVDNPRLGVTLQLPTGWQNEALGNEGTLAFEIRPKSDPDSASYVVRVLDASDRSLAGACTLLRYAVLINLGGQINSDTAVKIAGQPGRQIVYSGLSTTGAQRKFIRTYTVANKKLYVLHGVTSAAKWNAFLPAFLSMSASMTAVAPKVEEEESPKPPGN